MYSTTSIAEYVTREASSLLFHPNEGSLNVIYHIIELLTTLGGNLLEIPIELYQALFSHLETVGIPSDLLSRGNDETPDGEMGLRLRGRAIDMIQIDWGEPIDVPPEVERMLADMHDVMPESKKGGRSSGRDKWRFRFLVIGGLTKTPAELETRMTGKKKGIISKKLIDVEWSGGLSGDFSQDKALRDSLMASQIDNLTLGVVPDADIVEISHVHNVLMIRRGARVSYEEMPSLEKIDTIETIAHHIRNRIMM